MSNLKEDLEYILKNKDIAFKEANNIFDIYYIEKEDGKISSARGNTASQSTTQIELHQCSSA